MISQHGVWVESASRQAVSEELASLGNVPSEAELSALIELYAGSVRVSCEQADLFFASVGDVTPARRSSSAPPRDAAEVARGSWLDKLGSRSSAPPRGSAEPSQEPALSLAAHAPMPEEPITIEHGLEHLPATTYSAAPPPSALPSDDTPVALPLSSRPAPQLTAAESVVVERWGMAETSPEPAIEVEAADASLSAEEDELLDRWSDELDQTILGQSDESSSQPSSAPPPPSDAALHAATDAPERWSAPHLGGDEEAAPVVSDDDAPLSEAELSLLEQWSSPSTAPASTSTTPASTSTAPASTSTAPESPSAASAWSSWAPPQLGQDRPVSPLPPRTAPPVPPAIARASLRPTSATIAAHDEPLDMELEEAIELDADDLLEDDLE